MKKFLLCIMSLGMCSSAFAETTTAIAFSQQAGVVAGTAQACGIDTTVFGNRVSEAIVRLAQSNPDRAYALSAYQSSIQQAKASESSRHTIDCAQVAQEFKNLPLMRDDYQETVLSKIASPQQTSNLPSANPMSNIVPPMPLPAPPQIATPPAPTPTSPPGPQSAVSPSEQVASVPPGGMPNVAVTTTHSP